MRILISLLFSVAAASFVHLTGSRADAHEYGVGAITIAHPIALPPANGSDMTAGYMTLINESDAPDRLLSASSPNAQRVTLHATRQGAGGMVEMAALNEGVDIPAHGRVAFAPGGLHLMIEGLSGPLAAGEALPLRLTFARAGSVDILALVDRPGQSQSGRDQNSSAHSGHTH
ncbi:MAG: copper chaperone PCu(A)C [Hyphomonadaceae bacterium]